MSRAVTALPRIVPRWSDPRGINSVQRDFVVAVLEIRTNECWRSSVLVNSLVKGRM